jgi:hypothetical protein
MAILKVQRIAQMFETGDLAPKGTFVATCIDIKDVFGVERKKFRARKQNALT